MVGDWFFGLDTLSNEDLITGKKLELPRNFSARYIPGQKLENSNL